MSCQVLTVTTTTAARPAAMLATAARPASADFCRVYDFTPPVGGQALVTIGDENPILTFAGDQLVTIG